jgi:hypothetical protein
VRTGASRLLAFLTVAQRASSCYNPRCVIIPVALIRADA